MISLILVAQFWKQLKVVLSLEVIKLITKVLCLFLYDVQLHSSETDLVLIVYQNCKFKFEIDDHSFPCFQAEDRGVQFFWKFKLFCEMFQQHKTFVFLLSSFNSCKEVTKEQLQSYQNTVVFFVFPICSNLPVRQKIHLIVECNKSEAFSFLMDERIPQIKLVLFLVAISVSR